MARLRKLITWFRGSASPKRKKKTARRHQSRDVPALRASARRRHHTTMQTATSPTGRGRWVHRSVAQRFNVPEDAVRRIYTAVQTAKRQGLHGGYMVDLIERSVGRRLVGYEYDVAKLAKEHLGYDPPGGYQGPMPKGSAKEPARPSAAGVKHEAVALVSGADRAIRGVLDRYKQWSRSGSGAWDKDKTERTILGQAADDLDVAADLYEEAGAKVHAGTLRQRAKFARQGDLGILRTYGR